MNPSITLPDQARIEDLLTSGDFDPFWYDEAYPDVRLSGLGPAEHYLLIGRRLGRPPRDISQDDGQLPSHASNAALASLPLSEPAFDEPLPPLLNAG